MIGRPWVVTMARYNAWRNADLLAAAGGLDAAARDADRGAFFGSITRTLSHLLWADTVWMSRFDRGAPPPCGLADSARLHPDWPGLAQARAALDAVILDWAGRVDEGWLAGPLRWRSALVGGEVERPAALCVTHFFNHQTHHRGQVHAMLTAAGARCGDTDLFLMPDP